MSVPFGSFVLSWDEITQQIRSTFEQFIDPRQGKNTRYTLVDAGLSAFSIFFMQSPSFLEYQRRLEQAHGKNNAQTLFGVHKIPSDNQIKPGLDKVIPLAPECVQPQDGTEKQDCELNAAKRWLPAWSETERVPNITLLGDDLYCHEPFCRQGLDRGFDFILVCKPTSHARVYEWVEFLERSGGVKTVMRTPWTGKRREVDTYRYAAAIPLRDGRALADQRVRTDDGRCAGPCAVSQRVCHLFWAR